MSVRAASSWSRASLFASGPLCAYELGAGDMDALQVFFDANPEYFETVNGRPPGPNDAQEEFVRLPPEGMTFNRKWILGFVGPETDALIGMATVLSDLIADRVWHIGLYIIATSLHGSGAGRELYRALEAWMRENGAAWLRLGVVIGNVRAERFWERMGYVEVRQRRGVESGFRVSDLRVLVKDVGGGSLADYLAHVPRDHPEAP